MEARPDRKLTRNRGQMNGIRTEVGANSMKNVKKTHRRRAEKLPFAEHLYAAAQAPIERGPGLPDVARDTRASRKI